LTGEGNLASSDRCCQQSNTQSNLFSIDLSNYAVVIDEFNNLCSQEKFFICTAWSALPRTGHSPLLAGYLHRIGLWDSATCPHCNDADETAEHLVLPCPAHNQARRDIWLGGKFNTDPRRLWDFLERIGVGHHPLTGSERERERERACFIRLPVFVMLCKDKT